MSDCSSNAWRVPEQREPGALYMHGHPGTDYASVTAIEVDGQRFERVTYCRECRYAYELADGMYDCIGELVETWNHYDDEPKENPVPPDGFCKWGEPKVVSADD